MTTPKEGGNVSSQGTCHVTCWKYWDLALLRLLEGGEKPRISTGAEVEEGRQAMLLSERQLRDIIHRWFAMLD